MLNFPRIIDWLTPSHRVIGPTLRGYGESTPKPRDFPPDFYQRDARDLLALLDELAIDRARLLGYSDGGEVALGAAAMQPERFEAVVVWGAVGHFGPQVRPAAQRMFPAHWMTDHERQVHGIDQPDAFILRWIRAVHRIIDSGGDISRSQAHHITAPLLMLLGADDALNPVEAGEAFVTRAPNARLEVLDCGHAVHDDRWPEFQRLTGAFLGL
jgi:valacyclovir hydrolase